VSHLGRRRPPVPMTTRVPDLGKIERPTRGNEVRSRSGLGKGIVNW